MVVEGEDSSISFSLFSASSLSNVTQPDTTHTGIIVTDIEYFINTSKAINHHHHHSSVFITIVSLTTGRVGNLLFGFSCQSIVF